MYALPVRAALSPPVYVHRAPITAAPPTRIHRFAWLALQAFEMIVFALVSGSAPAVAETPLSLGEAIELAIRQSPQLSAQRSAITAAEQATVSARELPDPKLKVGIDNLPLEGPDRYSVARDFMTMRKIGVMQDFPTAEKREIKGRRAEFELARERSMLSNAHAVLRRDVALVWIDRHFAERSVLVIDKQYAETALQREGLQAGLRASKTQASELLALEVNLQFLLDRRAEFEKQAARAKALLSRWVGEASTRPLSEFSDQLDSGRDRDRSLHALRHPHLETLERQIGIAQTEADLARAATRPDWGLEVAYAQRGPGYSNMLSFQLSIDLPVFQERRQSRELAAKLAQLEQARATKEDARRQHLAEAGTAWAEWEAATVRLKRYEESLLPLADERIKLALAAYRGGQGALSPVLEARRAELELRLQKIQLAADQGRAYAQLLYFLPEEAAK